MSDVPSPAKRQRAPKIIEERIDALEAHLFFLAEDIDRSREWPVYLKRLAAELRVLVCRTRANKPLLLDLMDVYGFVHEVHPPGPPFDKMPITMVGDRTNPDWKKLAADLAAELKKPSPDHKGLLEQQAALRRPIPFREYVDSGLAMLIANDEYSNAQLALAVAQQAGSAHEDEMIDVGLVQARSIQIGGQESTVAALRSFAEFVLNVGLAFMKHLVDSHDYALRYFQVTPAQGLSPEPRKSE